MNRKNPKVCPPLLELKLSRSLDFVGNCARVPPLNGRRIRYPDRLFCAKLTDASQGQYFVLVFNTPFVRDSITAKAKSSAGHQRISIGSTPTRSHTRSRVATSHCRMPTRRACVRCAIYCAGACTWSTSDPSGSAAHSSARDRNQQLVSRPASDGTLPPFGP